MVHTLNELDHGSPAICMEGMDRKSHLHMGGGGRYLTENGRACSCLTEFRQEGSTVPCSIFMLEIQEVITQLMAALKLSCWRVLGSQIWDGGKIPPLRSPEFGGQICGSG